MSARDEILRAAEQIAVQHGVLGLSVDQVVQQAGVSKGSFFYHFDGKDAMLRALLTHCGARFEQAIEAEQRAGSSYGKALIRVSIREVTEQGGLMAALLSAVLIDPGLRPVVRDYQQSIQDKLCAEGVPKETAWLLRLALDGLLLSSTLGLASFRQERVERTEQMLLAMLPGGAA